MSVDYAAELKALDAQHGRVFTIDDFKCAAERLQRQPESLTEADAVLIGYFCGETGVTTARARCGQARMAEVTATLPATVTKSSAASGGPSVKAKPGTMGGVTIKETVKAIIETIDRAIKSPMTEKLIRGLIAEQITPRDATIASLETRLAALEATPTLRDGGIWRHGSTYAVGDVTTQAGSAWVCTKAHQAEAAFDHSCWRLLVKRGADGKNGIDGKPGQDGKGWKGLGLHDA